MTTVYTTKTPAINTKKYTFPYTFKRDAYIDACYCILALNKAAKDASTDMRFYIYRLKHRWIEKLYREGYCVHASMGERLVWQFIFLVDGVKFQWHLPSQEGVS